MTARKQIFAWIVLTWMFVTIVAYYIFHKPISIDQVLVMGKSVWGIVVASSVILAGAAIGRLLFSRLLQGFTPRSIVLLALEAGLGLGTLSLVWLLVGLIGGFETILAWAVLIIIGFGARHQILDWCRDMVVVIIKVIPNTRTETYFAAFVLFMIIVALLSALAPTSAWDALLYHLTGPKANIASGRLEINPWLPETGYPQGLEMLYTWVILLGSSRAAGVLHWFFGFLTLLLVWQWGEELVDSETGWLACAILVSATTFATMMGKAYVDVATIFFTATGIAAINHWRDTELDAALMLCGFSAGFAFGTKYTGVVIGIGLAVLIAIAQPRRVMRNLMVFGVPAIVVSIPWLFKNALLAGNPTYPFFFNGLGWDSIRADWFSQVGTGLLYSAPWKLLAAPLIMTIVGKEGIETWHATFGPLFIMLVPLIAIRWKHHTCRTWLRDTLIFFIVLYLIWLYGAAVSRLMIQPRFLFPALPPLAVLSAMAYGSLRSLEKASFSIHRVLGFIIALVLFLTAFRFGIDMLQRQDLPVLTGALSEEDYLYHRLGWYYAAVQKIGDLPDGSRVLFLFEPRSYYCPSHRCLPDGILDTWYHARRQGGTAASMAQDWREENVSHVLFYALGAQTLREAGKDPFTEEDWVELDRLQSNQLKLVENFGDVYMLYELPPR